MFAVLQAMERVFAPGSKVVAAPTGGSSLQALGTVGPKGRVAALLVNPRGAGRALLTGLAPRAKATVRTMDASSQSAERTVAADANGRLTLELPTRSVVTVVAAS